MYFYSTVKQSVVLLRSIANVCVNDFETMFLLKKIGGKYTGEKPMKLKNTDDELGYNEDKLFLWIK